MSLFASHSFKMIFKSNRDSIDANIIAVRAPFHGGSLKEYTSRIKNLANFTALLAASVILVEELINRLRKISDQQILVSGISLGGWVTNLHRSYFNSADTYVPLLAGAALAEVFLSSKYKKLTGELALGNPEKIRSVLNFEKAFDKVKSNNLSPLLGLYDKFIKYERQKKCYQERYPIKTLRKGHVTSLLTSQKLYNHIIDNY